MKLILFTSIFLNAQTPGSQDMSFGTNGSTEYLYNPTIIKGFQAYAMKTLPDNSFFVGGVSNWGCSSNQYYTGLLTKFNQNGILDSSFSQNGANENFGVLRDIKDSNDGNYYLLNQYSILTKIDASGNRITTWGDNGSINLPYEQDIRDWKETPANEIIITTVRRNYDNKLYSTLYKYNANGTLQTSFGNNGKIEFATSPNWIFTNVEIDNVGNYIFIGRKRVDAVYDDSNLIIFKTNSNGVPVANFGTNGIVTIANYTIYYNQNLFTFLMPDNSFVVSTSGKMGPLTSNRHLILKILSNGNLDSNFNNGFKFTSTNITPINSYFIGNNFYIIGEVGSISYMIGKLNSFGNADNTYGTNGYITIPKLAGNHNATRTMLQGDKIIIAETMDNFYCAQSNWKLVMRRFSFDALAPLSSSENDFTKNINIYPNPADNKIFLEGFDKEIKLHSIDGRKMEAKIKNEGKTLSIDISHLIKGIYILTGKNLNGKTISKKFIKK